MWYDGPYNLDSRGTTDVVEHRSCCCCCFRCCRGSCCCGSCCCGSCCCTNFCLSAVWNLTCFNRNIRQSWRHNWAVYDWSEKNSIRIDILQHRLTTRPIQYQGNCNRLFVKLSPEVKPVHDQTYRIRVEYNYLLHNNLAMENLITQW